MGIIGGTTFFVAYSISGEPWYGLAVLTFMALFTAGFIFLSRHSETVRALIDHRDERITQMDLMAATTAGLVVLGTVLVLLVVELTQGRDGSPYAQLGALGGATYAVTIVIQRLRT